MSDPRPVQVTNPGTDFIVYATGAGANVEDMPSYQSDPQRQTGNLPGIARSSFNNRVQRQGAFVATAISTFVWEVLSIYVPDDGDLDNYVANFKAALRAYITPEGALPGGPYLPIAGGTMLGNIDFNTGATIVLANNTWLRAKDAGGTSHGMLRLGTDNNHYIGDGSAPFVIFGSTPIIGSGMFWSARDTGNVAHGLLGIQGDNNTAINAFNALYINSSNAWFNSSIIIPNGQFYYTKNAAGAPIAMLTTRGDNFTLIAQGAPSDTYIYSGRQIVLTGQVSVTGPLYLQAVSISSTLNVVGATTLSSLQVNGASNFYARPNVNNSVGMTITGDIATNSIAVYGGGISVDNGASIRGSTQCVYLLVYNPGNNDPLQVRCDPGHFARIAYHHVNNRIWTAGCDTQSRFAIADESAGGYRFWIDTAGNTGMAGNLTIGWDLTVPGGVYCNNIVQSNTMNTNYITVNGNITTRGAMYVGWDGYYFNYIGSGFTYTNGNFRVGNQLECIGNFVCSQSIYAWGGELHVGGRADVGDLYSHGNVFISNDGWFYLGNSPALKWLNFHPYRYLYWDRNDGSLWWSSDNYGHTQWQYGGDWYFKNWQGPIIGKAFWQQGLYSRNLQRETVLDIDRACDIIAELKPIRFRKLRRLRQRHNAEPYYLDEEPEEIGFLIDEVKAVLPQAVVSVPTRSEVMPSAPPYTDPDTPLPAVSHEDDAPDALIIDVILAVAVKAIKEMNERLMRLEERLAA